MLAPGLVIDRYELVCPIGDGGMAHVWAARQRGAHGFEKLVAVKVIHSRFAEDETFREMFLDEARIVSQIRHQNVAQVLDLGETGSLLYLVMEYVDGESLFELTAPQRTVPIPIAVRIAADACAGLQAVHSLVDANGRSRNVVHRDVSPQNLLLGTSGEVKLIDFGLAQARDRVAAATGVGVVKGRARYMAPEQARGEAVGPYTDVFALGATLFRMLAGHAPYAASSDVQTMQALLASAPALHTLPPSIPPAVAEAVRHAIAPNVAARFQTARELGAALEQALAGEARTPDVNAWVNANLGDGAREQRARLFEGSSAAAPPMRAQVPSLPSSHAAAPQPGVAKAPSFMDVGALVAKATRGEPGGPPPVRAREAPEAPDDLEDLIIRGAHLPDPAPEQKAVPAPRTNAGGLGRALKVAILALVLVLVSVGFLFLAPSLVRDRAIALAREAGFEVTIEGVGVGFGGVTLRGVSAKAMRTPGIGARIEEVHLTGLSGREVRVLGLDARLEGPRSDLEVGIAALIADNRARFAGTPGAPRHLSVVNARLVWGGPGGERFASSDIGLELDSHSAGSEDLHGSIGRFELKSPQTTLGPWALSFERTGASSRLRLMFDPPVPDGPSALIVTSKTGVSELTVKVPRSSFENVGVRPSEIGLPANDATDIQLSLTGRLSESERSEVTFDATVWGLRPKGFSGAIDVHVEGGASSTPDKPFELEKTSVSVGPFVAGVTGTVVPHARGLRLDAMFRTIPIPCERLARAEAKNMGPLVATLQALGQSTGALRVTGQVNASGALKLDTAALEETNVTWLAKETCGVSIFGR